VPVTTLMIYALATPHGAVPFWENPARMDGWTHLTFAGLLLSPGGVPFRTIGVMSFLLAGILLLAAAGDVRIMRFGVPRGGPRLARHLWRMCFALFIAAGSFLSIRERVATILPEPFTTGPMRGLPILLLFGAMFYWLWRVRGRRTFAVLVRHDSVPVAPRAN
jgi:hypothetical protein